jgi:catechol 2,3-dioxygenase
MEAPSKRQQRGTRGRLIEEVGEDPHRDAVIPRLSRAPDAVARLWPDRRNSVVNLADIHSRIGSVELRVRDAERAVRFYHDAVGLFVSVSAPERIDLASAEGGDRLLTVIVDPHAPSRPPRSAGLYHLALLAPSRQILATMVARMIRNGVALEGSADHLVGEAIYFRDPERNGVEIYTDRPVSSWVWDEDGVRMDSLPLDLNGLLALELDHSLPVTKSVTIGHVHLHVADLDRAVRFYVETFGLDVTARLGNSAAFL